jgi:hypothetical protein
MTTTSNNNAVSVDTKSEATTTTTVATIKKQVQNGAVVAVQCATYPAVLVLQTAADLINIGQAGLINAIDGTPVIESMKECETWTQTQQAYVVNAGMKVREKFLRQREANRKHDIEKTKALLDKLEGVEQVQPKIVAKSTTEPKVVTTEPIATTTEAPAIVQPIVPTAPVTPTQPEAVSVPVPPAPAPTPRKPRTSAAANKSANEVPTMTAAEAFQK